MVLLNVLSFWDPLRILVKGGIEAGFIRPSNERLIIFVNGPADQAQHTSYNWGNAALGALDSWRIGDTAPLFDWTKTVGEGMGYKET